jgi:hypothetical protein
MAKCEDVCLGHPPHVLIHCTNRRKGQPQASSGPEEFRDVRVNRAKAKSK